jgi:general secretion pathway protein H
MTRSRRAFTLLELIVVVALVGLAAGIVVARLPDVRGLDLDASARRLADTLTLARDRAVLRAAPAHVALDLAGGAWTTDARAERVALPAAVRLRSVTANGDPAVRHGTAVIRFDPAGDALPAQVELADEHGRVARVVLPAAAPRAEVWR